MSGLITGMSSGMEEMEPGEYLYEHEMESEGGPEATEDEESESGDMEQAN